MGDDIEVVISGIGGQFPRCSSYEEFSKRVLDNEYLVGYSGRWTKEVDGVEPWIGETAYTLFDHLFFGMHPAVAYWADPTYRAIFERSLESIIDAGINPTSLRGSNTKVYYTNSRSEYNSRILNFHNRQTSYVVMGINQAMGPNRVSYMFDFQGESVGVASTSSSVHVGFELALQSIKTRACDSVLVAVSNTVAYPSLSYEYQNVGCLSQDGVTRSFDPNGTGFARGDATVVFFLQRADQAKRCYARLVGCGAQYGQPRLHFDMLLPSPAGLESFLSKVYDKARVDPRDVEYVEADGSGWPLQDEAELLALAGVFGPGRQSSGRKSLLVGAAKSNTGNTESSAGAISVCRAIVAMESGTIPATINCSRSRGKDDILQVVTQNSPFQRNSRTAVAVNTIGLSGDLGHSVLRPNLKEKKPVDPSKELPRLIPLCGRTEETTLELAEKIPSYPFDPEYLRLVQDVFSPGIRGYDYRSFVICPPAESEVPVALKMEKRTIWFVYSGMGSQWAGMGAGLMDLPIFRDTIERLHAILEPKGVNLKEVITETGPEAFNNILKSFVGITACQIALTNVLSALGLQPDGIIGHSVGETACAYADGCLTEAQTILAAWARGKASNEATLIKGMMAAIGLGYADIVGRLPPTIEVACRNSSASSTISGPAEDVNRFVRKLSDEGVFARTVNVSDIAYHSRYIQPAGPFLLEHLLPVIPEPKSRSSKWVTTSVPPELVDQPEARYCSAEYMTNNLLRPVLFEDGLKCIPSDALMIELAPHGLLQAIVKRACPDNMQVALCQRGAADPIRLLLTAIGKIYVGGANPNVAVLYPEVSFPVSRGTPPLSPLVGWYHANTSSSYIDLVGKPRMNFSRSVVEFSPHMKLRGALLFTLSDALEMVCEYLAKVNSRSEASLSVIFEDVTITNYGAIPLDGSCLNVGASVNSGSGRFEVYTTEEDYDPTSNTGCKVLVSGKAHVRTDEDDATKPLPEADFNGVESLQAEDIFDDLESRGMSYSEKFKRLSSIGVGKQDWQVRIGSCDTTASFLESVLQAALLQHMEHAETTALPRTIQRLEVDFSRLLNKEVHVHFHLPSGIMQCPGMYMQGLTLVEPGFFGSSWMPSRALASLQFVPFGKTNLKRVSSFLGLALSLAQESAPEAEAVRVLDLQRDSDPGGLGVPLRSLLQHHSHVQVELTNFAVEELAMPAPDAQVAVLAVSGPGTLAEAARLVAHLDGLLLTCTPAPVKAGLLSLRVLAEQQFAGYAKGSTWFTVLGKPTPVPVGLQVVQLAEGTPPPARVAANTVLVWRGLPVGGVVHTVEEVRKQPHARSCTMVFILDKDAPQFSVTEPVYAEQLKLRQLVNVLQHGVWGCWRELSMPQSVTGPALSITSLAGVKIDALGLNPRVTKSTTDRQASCGHLDYVGRLSSGERVMGVVQVTSERRRPRADPLLRWRVPEQWSDKEAATVPFAYASMYNALCGLIGLGKGQSILIHEGMSAMGQAAIRVAIQHQCSPIFVTVASEAQRSLVRKHFPQVEDRHVLSCANESFEWHIRVSTRTRGVDVVLNALPGEQLRASLRCVAKYGRVLHYGRQDMLAREKFGMYLFDRSAAMFGEAGSRLFTSIPEHREAVLRAVQEGIDTGAVQPIIGAKAVSLAEADDVVCWAPNGCSKWIMEVTRGKSQAPPGNGRARSYVVVGGGQHDCLQVAGWLSLQGARHVRVAPNIPAAGQLGSTLVRHRQRNLLHRNGTNLHVDEIRHWDEAAAEKVVQAAASAAPLDAVIVLSSGDAAPCRVPALLHGRLAAHPEAALVVLADEPRAAGALSTLCEARRGAGLRAACLVGPLSSAADHLAGLLDDSVGRPAVTIMPSVSAGITCSGFEPRLLRPLSGWCEALAAQGSRLGSLPPGGVRLRETLHVADPRENFPLYVLAPAGVFDAAAEAALLQLSLRVVPPVVCVDYRPAADLRQLAAAIVKELTAARPAGPFNLIGLNLSNTLTLEVAHLLEQKQHNPVVFLLDGDVLQVKKWAASMTDVALLREAFANHRSALEVLEAVSDSDSWASLVPRLLSVADSGRTREQARAALEAAREAVRAVAGHQPSSLYLTRCLVHVVKTSPQDQVSVRCTKTENLYQLEMPTAEVQAGLGSAWLATVLSKNSAWSKLANKKEIHNMIIKNHQSSLVFH